MAEKKSRRVYAGYYNRYDGKLIYVARVIKDIDTGEDIVICQYANYSDTGEYYTITKASFCEQVECNGQMVNKYSRRTQQKIDYTRLLIQEENSMPEPKRRKPKDQLDEYDNRGYRRSKTYYAYAKDLCEHYLIDRRKQQLCIERKKYVCISAGRIFIALSFNELRYFNELKAQYVGGRRSGDWTKAQHLGNGKKNALQSLGIRPVLG